MLMKLITRGKKERKQTNEEEKNSVFALNSFLLLFNSASYRPIGNQCIVLGLPIEVDKLKENINVHAHAYTHTQLNRRR